MAKTILVSIHAALASGDDGQRTRHTGGLVSIHAALASGDGKHPTRRPKAPSFNPRRSCERRPIAAKTVEVCKEFQSTPLLRAATGSGGAVTWRTVVSIHAALASGDVLCPPFLLRDCVSIHAALASGDPQIRKKEQGQAGFNPRRSCERRLRRSHMFP